MDNTEVLTMIIQSDLRELDRVSVWLEQSCQAAGGCRMNETLRHLQLACDEWITNIISYGDKRDGLIYLALTHGQQGWTLVIEDEAAPYNPLERGEVDVRKNLDEKPIGGLGIHFIRTVMNDLTYERVNGRNRLTMTKREDGV